MAPRAAAAAPTPQGSSADVGLDATPVAPRGAEVTAVRAESAAAAAGLRPSDHFLRVGPATVTSPATARRLLAAAAGRVTFIVFERDSTECGVLVP